MKRSLFIAFLLITFKINSFSQNKIIFEDDFNNNKNDWQLRNDSNFLIEIKNGVLHLEKYQKGRIKTSCFWHHKTIPAFNTLHNFSITLVTRFLSNGNNELVNMQWGNRNNSSSEKKDYNFYSLGFMLQGEVKLNYFDSNWTFFARKNIKTILNEINFNPKQFNKYEYAQKDGFIIFSINNHQLIKQQCKPIPGNNIGFQQCLKSAWEIDKITIRDLGTENNLPQISVTPKLIAATGNELKVYPNPFNNNLQVNFNLDKDETVQLYLIDLNGEILQQQSLKLRKGNQNILLYADVTPGSYVIKVQAGNKKPITSVIIKQ